MIIGNLTASARQVTVGQRPTTKLKDANWQDRAWAVYDELGPVRYAVEYPAGIARRIAYGLAIDEAEGPAPIDVGPAVDALDDAGGMPMLRRVVGDLIRHWRVVGEAYLVAVDDRWEVFSTQELRRNVDGAIVQYDGDQPVGQVDADRVWRIWRPHPRFSQRATSALQAVLPQCEALILLNREIQARSRSRLPAGMLVYNNAVDLTDPNNPDARPLDQELTDRLMRPIADPAAAESLVPMLVGLSGGGAGDNVADLFHLVTFARDWDVSEALREQLLRELAVGMDMPAEVLLGLGDVNHWGAWLINRQAVEQHVDPEVQAVLQSLTDSWLHPLLEAAGADDPDLMLWRDLAPAVVAASDPTLTLQAHDRALISNEAARRDLDLTEDDAPAPEELAERAAWIQATKGTSAAPPAAAAEGPAESQEPGAVAAAAAPVTGETLTAIDNEVTGWLLEAANAELDRMLTRAAGLVAATVDDAAEGMPTFIGRAKAKLRAAQDSARRAWSRLIGRPLARSQAENEAVEQAAAALTSVLSGAVYAALHDSGPAVDAAVLGEVAPGRIAAADLLNVVDLAGGGPRTPGLAGIGNGEHLVGIGERAGVRTLTYRWVYGLAPRLAPFPPHVALDGATFKGWDDDRLISGSFISGHYRPGDHRGCLCSFVRQVMCSLPALSAAGDLNDCAEGDLDPALAGSFTIDSDPRQVASAAKHYIAARGGAANVEIKYTHAGGDEVLGDIYRRRGYDAPAQHVGDISTIPGPTLHRGIPQAQYVDDLVNGGPYHPGLGIYGNGTYSAGPTLVDDGFGEAMSYAAGNADNVTAFKLQPGSKVATYDQMRDYRRQVVDQIDDEMTAVFQNPDRDAALAQWTELSRARELVGDEGRLASLMGYDAVHVEGPEYWVVLNRDRMMMP